MVSLADRLARDGYAQRAPAREVLSSFGDQPWQSPIYKKTRKKPGLRQDIFTLEERQRMRLGTRADVHFIRRRDITGAILAQQARKAHKAELQRQYRAKAKAERDALRQRRRGETAA